MDAMMVSGANGVGSSNGQLATVVDAGQQPLFVDANANGGNVQIQLAPPPVYPKTAKTATNNNNKWVIAILLLLVAITIYVMLKK